jgi:hypothetical protein
MADDTASIRHAKIEFLELMVMWLAYREMMRETDPAAAAKNLATNIVSRVERNMAPADNSREADVARIIASEVARSFFDRLSAQVQAPGHQT